MSQIPHFRVFLSSPGDVSQERKIALEVIENLPNRPAFREKVAFRVIAWDKKGAGTRMRASLTPQEAINLGLPKPSECDLVIVLFWARMGTPFEMGGQKFLSGTHWELLDALNSDRTYDVMIFHRTQDPQIKMSDPERTAKVAQYDLVQTFLKSDLFYDPASGAIKRGVNQYIRPNDFREQFETFFEEVILELLAKEHGQTGTLPPDSDHIQTLVSTPWQGSPFPGLRAFTPDDAPIFFGRGRETDELLAKIMEQRFVAVVGASGSGKSSLVGAGIIPTLSEPHSPTVDWMVVSLTPTKWQKMESKEPLGLLYHALADVLPALRPENSVQVPSVKRDFIAELTTNPTSFADMLVDALKHQPATAEVVLFLDQFEEVFTLVGEEQRAPFLNLLTTDIPRLRIVLTMRADFYHKAVEHLALSEKLRAGHFPLAKPSAIALYEMIVKPAERAGLIFEEGLAEQIVTDTGDDAGALALMAYTLDELYNACKDKQHITFEDYKTVGGVQGAIGKRAEEAFKQLTGTNEDKTQLLERVFHQLVSVDERGVATRQRLSYDPATLNPAEAALIEAFTTARLLVTDVGTPNVVSSGVRAINLEIAHEALLRNWERLANWIEQTRGDLFLLAQMRRAAQLWEEHNRSRNYLWLGERGQDIQAMLERLNPTLNKVEKAFARPELDHLLAELEDNTTTHIRRAEIGDKLAELGDTRPGVGLRPDGLPDIVWCFVQGRWVEANEINMLVKSQTVDDFYIAKYPITYQQFKAFYDAPDGYQQDEWWEGLAYPRRIWDQNRKIPNYPADNIAWVNAMAFTRWLTAKIKVQVSLPQDFTTIQLPTEAQWILAVGDQTYPWGYNPRPYAVNTQKSNLGRTVAVGMYPAGRADCGAYDLLGNTWEWMFNDFETDKVALWNSEAKAWRGGAYNKAVVTVGSRNLKNPDIDLNADVCIRLVLIRPHTPRGFIFEF